MLEQILLVISILALVALALTVFLAVKFYKLRERYLTLKNNRLQLFNGSLESLSKIHSRRTGLSQRVFELEVSNPSKTQIDEVFSEVDAYLRSTLEDTRDIFERFTLQKCSVTLKLVDLNSNDEIEIQTFIRDVQSQPYRSQSDTVVPVLTRDNHSPFAQMLASPASTYFMDNDLRALSENGEYLNVNKNWKKFYNATCIVPISNPSPATGSNEILGFLCVDSLHGQFDEKFSVSMLRIIALALFYTFEKMIEIQDLYDPTVDEAS